MIYPKLIEWQGPPNSREVWEHAGITETEYVYKEMGFKPKLIKLKQREPENIFFSFFP